MKKFYLTAMAAVLTLGAFGAVDAHAHDKRVKQHNVNARAQHAPTYDATLRDAEAQKWVYNGSSAYRGGLTGQVAVRDTRDNGNAFVVRPVRGDKHQFNASLRYGDMSQSREHRGNFVFNN